MCFTDDERTNGRVDEPQLGCWKVDDRIEEEGSLTTMARTNDERRGRNAGSKRVIASVAVATVLACAGTMPTGAEAKLFGRKEARTTPRGRVAWRRFATNQVARSPFAANIAQLGQTMKNEGPSCVETCAKLTEQSGPDNTKPCDSQPGCVYNHGDKTCISMISNGKDDPKPCPTERIDGGMKGNVCNGPGLPTCYSMYSAKHPDAFDADGHYTYPKDGDEEYEHGDTKGTGPASDPTTGPSTTGPTTGPATATSAYPSTTGPSTTGPTKYASSLGDEGDAKSAYPASTEQPTTAQPTASYPASPEQPKTAQPTPSYPASTEQPKTAQPPPTSTGAFTSSAVPTTTSASPDNANGADSTAKTPAHHGHKHGHHAHHGPKHGHHAHHGHKHGHHAHHKPPGPSGVDQLEGGPSDPPPETPPAWPQDGPSCVETCAKLTEQSGPDNTKPCDSQPGCVFNHGDKTCISMISQSKDDPTTCPPHRMDDGMKGTQCNGEGLPTCYEMYSAQHPDAFDENGHYTYPFYGDDEYDELYQMDEDDNNDKIGSLGQVHRNVRILAEQNDVYYDSRSSFSKLTVALGAAFAFASGFVARGVSRRRQYSVSDETRALGQSTQAMYGAAV